MNGISRMVLPLLLLWLPVWAQASEVSCQLWPVFDQLHSKLVSARETSQAFALLDKQGV